MSKNEKSLGSIRVVRSEGMKSDLGWQDNPKQM